MSPCRHLAPKQANCAQSRLYKRTRNNIQRLNRLANSAWALSCTKYIATTINDQRRRRRRLVDKFSRKFRVKVAMQTNSTRQESYRTVNLSGSKRPHNSKQLIDFGSLQTSLYCFGQLEFRSQLQLQLHQCARIWIQWEAIRVAVVVVEFSHPSLSKRIWPFK